MGIIYTSSPIFIILISAFFFKEKLSKIQLLGLAFCFLGVISIIIKGDINLLIGLEFTIGDLWMLGAAIGWALYAVFLLNWRSKFSLFSRFTIIAFFGALSLLPFSLIENIFIQQVVFNEKFYFWSIFAAISPGIIAFSLYAQTQKYLGASITGFTLYLFTVYGAFYGIFLFGEELQSVPVNQTPKLFSAVANTYVGHINHPVFGDCAANDVSANHSWVKVRGINFFCK